MGTYEKIEPYLMYALTPLHAGTGRGYQGYVDLPIQRDWLGLPTIWGSSIKGALRSAFKRAPSTTVKEERIIFGPERERAHEHASAVAVLDAKLLFIPVRSLRGTYAYITTPLMLRNALSIAELKNDENLKNALNTLIGACKDGRGVAVSKILTINGKVYLRETEFAVDTEPSLLNPLKQVVGKVFDEECLRRVIILPDDLGIDFVSRSTMIITRVALNYQRKTVKEGALWDEEYVPETSVFIIALLASHPRAENPPEDLRTADDVLKKLLTALRARNDGTFYLALGGHETIGKGLVKFVKLSS